MNMSKEEILGFNIPTGIPYVFEFDDDMNFIKDYFLGDTDEVKKLMEIVANQANKKIKRNKEGIEFKEKTL